jgi:hypothetical protein
MSADMDLEAFTAALEAALSDDGPTPRTMRRSWTVLDGGAEPEPGALHLRPALRVIDGGAP